MRLLQQYQQTKTSLSQLRTPQINQINKLTLLYLVCVQALFSRRERERERFLTALALNLVTGFIYCLLLLFCFSFVYIERVFFFLIESIRDDTAPSPLGSSRYGKAGMQESRKLKPKSETEKRKSEIGTLNPIAGDDNVKKRKTGDCLQCDAPYRGHLTKFFTNYPCKVRTVVS